MEEKNVQELVKNLMGSVDEEKKELSLDDLDGVSGGVITASQMNLLDTVLKNAKNDMGLSMSEVLGYVDMYYDTYHALYPNVKKEEVVSHIKKVWASL